MFAMFACYVSYISSSFFFWGIKNVRYVKSKNFLGLYIFYAAM